MYRNELNNNDDRNKCYKDYKPPNIDKVSVENKNNPLLNQYIDAQNNNLCEKEKHSNLLFATPKVKTLVDWKNIRTISNKIPDELEYRHEI
jgi:hypothetical protein